MAAPALLPRADFISIGSNDLMQFLFAADRSAPGLSGRYDLLSPPVLDLLEHLLREAAEARRAGVGLRRGGVPAAGGVGACRGRADHAVDALDRHPAG